MADGTPTLARQVYCAQLFSLPSHVGTVMKNIILIRLDFNGARHRSSNTWNFYTTMFFKACTSLLHGYDSGFHCAGLRRWEGLLMQECAMH